MVRGKKTAIAAAVPQILTVAASHAAPPVEPATHAVGKPLVADESPLPAAGDTPVVLPSRTVLLRPLQVESENPEVQAALREFYSTFAAGLRTVPGLLLLQPDQAGESSEPHTDFRLTFVGSGDDGSAQIGAGFNEDGELTSRTRRQPATRTPRKWEVAIQVEGFRAQVARERAATKGKYATMLMIMTGGRLAADCRDARASQSPTCRPAALAASLVEQLHIKFLPADPELRRSLQARVLDAGQSFATRFDALELLARNTSGGDLGPEIIRAALDIVATAPNDYARRRVMDLLRGRGQPALLRALIDMSSLEPDTSLRTQALSILIADYKADPAARATLESAASNDPLPLVRQVAARALSGDAAWDEYVVATVKDASLTPAERFAPLAYLVQTDQKPAARKLLDDAVIAALVDVLPPLVDEQSAAGLSSAVLLLAMLPDVNSPAVIDLMLASLDGARTFASRAIIIDALYKHNEDPRVRSKLEKSPPMTPTRSCAKKAARL